MAVKGSIAGAVKRSTVGVVTDWEQPNSGGGGGFVPSPWDISGFVTAVDSESVSWNAYQSDAYGAFAKPDGTVLYVSGSGGSTVLQFTMSTAWDLSTLDLVGSTSTAALFTAGVGRTMTMDPTGTYLLFARDSSIGQWVMSTPWDVTSIGGIQSSFNPTEFGTDILSFSISDDGTKLFMLRRADDNIYEYTLSTAWNLSTATLTYTYAAGTALSDTGLLEIFLNSGGSQLFIVGSAGKIYDLRLGARDTLASGATLETTVTYTAGNAGFFMAQSGHAILIGGGTFDKAWGYTF